MATKEKETDKTGHLYQTEGETHEKQCGEEQPEKQEMGDGEEDTSSANSKRENHLEIVSTGKTENETPSETEETGREAKRDQDSKKEESQRNDSNQNPTGVEGENDPNKRDGCNSSSPRDAPDPQHETKGQTDQD